jgi:hypothetical protein
VASREVGAIAPRSTLTRSARKTGRAGGVAASLRRSIRRACSAKPALVRRVPGHGLRAPSRMWNIKGR